jgi:hypothetical protein
MIKIITEGKDQASNEVIEYLLAEDLNFTRINSDALLHFSYIISNTNIPDEAPVVWHRRGYQQLNPKELQNYPFAYHLWKEEDVVNKFYEKKNYSEKSTYFGGYIEEDQHNKLNDLYLAQKCDFRIPETLITNTKKEIIAFKKKHNKIITKPLKDLITFKEKDFVYSSIGTFLVEDRYIKQLDDCFAVSIFQEYIEKEIEIRVFYFDGRFFPMAIFSQNDEKTKIDFRNYNFEKQNRYIPFRLGRDITKKLQNFLKYKAINTCSIDLILTPDNDFVFLEINPQGQFSWVSKNCNYYIEKFIAQKLGNHERTGEKRF